MPAPVPSTIPLPLACCLGALIALNGCADLEISADGPAGADVGVADAASTLDAARGSDTGDTGATDAAAPVVSHEVHRGSLFAVRPWSDGRRTLIVSARGAESLTDLHLFDRQSGAVEPLLLGGTLMEPRGDIELRWVSDDGQRWLVVQEDARYWWGDLSRGPSASVEVCSFTSGVSTGHFAQLHPSHDVFLCGWQGDVPTHLDLNTGVVTRPPEGGEHVVYYSDADHLVWAQRQSYGRAMELQVLDVATGTSRPLGISAISVQLFDEGRWIVVIAETHPPYTLRAVRLRDGEVWQVSDGAFGVSGLQRGEPGIAYIDEAREVAVWWPEPLRTRRTHLGATALKAAASASGRYVALLTESRVNGPSPLYVVDVTTGALAHVADDVVHDSLAWSTTDRLVYARKVTNHYANVDLHRWDPVEGDLRLAEDVDPDGPVDDLWSWALAPADESTPSRRLVYDARAGMLATSPELLVRHRDCPWDARDQGRMLFFEANLGSMIPYLYDRVWGEFRPIGPPIGATSCQGYAVAEDLGRLVALVPEDGAYALTVLEWTASRRSLQGDLPGRGVVFRSDPGAEHGLLVYARTGGNFEVYAWDMEGVTWIAGDAGPRTWSSERFVAYQKQQHRVAADAPILVVVDRRTGLRWTPPYGSQLVGFDGPCVFTVEPGAGGGTLRADCIAGDNGGGRLAE